MREKRGNAAVEEVVKPDCLSSNCLSDFKGSNPFGRTSIIEPEKNRNL